VLSIWRHMGVRRRIRLNSLALWGALVLGAWLLGQSQMQFLSMAAFMTVALMVMTLLLESQFATPLELLKRQSLNVATGNNRQTNTCSARMKSAPRCARSTRSVSCSAGWWTM
jgi:aerotaxis receptor